MQKISFFIIVCMYLSIYGAHDQASISSKVFLTDEQFKTLINTVTAHKQETKQKEHAWIPSGSTVVKVAGTGVGIAALGYGINVYKKELGIAAVCAMMVPHASNICGALSRLWPYITVALSSPNSAQVHTVIQKAAHSSASQKRMAVILNQVNSHPKILARL